MAHFCPEACWRGVKHENAPLSARSNVHLIFCPVIGLIFSNEEVCVLFYMAS